MKSIGWNKFENLFTLLPKNGFKDLEMNRNFYISARRPSVALVPRGCVQVSLATFYSKFAKSTALAWYKYDTFQIHLVRFAPGYLL